MTRSTERADFIRKAVDQFLEARGNIPLGHTLWVGRCPVKSGSRLGLVSLLLGESDPRKLGAAIGVRELFGLRVDFQGGERVAYAVGLASRWRPPLSQEPKVCETCKELRPADEFPRSNQYGGRGRICRPCLGAFAREQYAKQLRRDQEAKRIHGEQMRERVNREPAEFSRKRLAAQPGHVGLSRGGLPNFSSLTKAYIPSEQFFGSEEWKRLRYFAITKHGRRCQCCGASPETGTRLQVDHVKPRSKYPELQWSLDNLQVLCEDCNLGKGAWDETDWRPAAHTETCS